METFLPAQGPALRPQSSLMAALVPRLLLAAYLASLTASWAEDVRIGFLVPGSSTPPNRSSAMAVQQIDAFNRSADGASVRILGVIFGMDFTLPESLQTWQPHFLINYLSCPLPPSDVAAAGAVQILLDAGDCADSVSVSAAAANGSTIVLQSNAWPAAAVEVIKNFSSLAVVLSQSLSASSAELLHRFSSAWQPNRQLALIAPDAAGAGSASYAANLSASIRSADATLLLDGDQAVLAGLVKQACNATLILARPLLPNDSSSACPHCQLSPSNLTDPFAGCASRPALCQFLRANSRLTAAAGLSGLVQTSALLRIVADVFGSAGGGLGVAAAVRQIRDSLEERQFVHCRPGGLAEPQYRGGFSVGSGLAMTTPLTSDRRSWLEGRHVVVGLKMVAPFTFPGTVTRDGFEANVTGLVIDMLNEIARQLKFTYSLRQPADGLWGGVYPNGTWNGMVKEILDGKIDFAIGPFTMTAIRQTVIDFSVAYMEDGNSILIKKPGQENPMFRVLSPFSLHSWLAILGSVFIAAICMFLFSYLSPFSAWNMDLPEKISDEVSLKENFWSVIGSLLQQGQDFYPVATSSRFVLGFWWIVSVVMMAYYTADMIGYLTLNIPAATVKNLEELASQSVIRPVVKSGTNVQTLFQTSAPGSTYSKIYSLMNDMPYITETYQGVDLVVNGSKQYAYISDRTQLRYIALTNCDLLLLSDIFNVATFGWPMPKGAVYKPDIDREIRRMIDSGLISRWIQKWWRAENICSQDSSLSDSAPIGIEESSGGFIIAAGFYGCGLLLLLFEYFVDAMSRRCRSNKPDLHRQQQQHQSQHCREGSYRTSKDHY